MSAGGRGLSMTGRSWLPQYAASAVTMAIAQAETRHAARSCPCCKRLASAIRPAIRHNASMMGAGGPSFAAVLHHLCRLSRSRETCSGRALPVVIAQLGAPLVKPTRFDARTTLIHATYMRCTSPLYAAQYRVLSTAAMSSMTCMRSTSWTFSSFLQATPMSSMTCMSR